MNKLREGCVMNPLQPETPSLRRELAEHRKSAGLREDGQENELNRCRELALLRRQQRQRQRQRLERLERRQRFFRLRDSLPEHFDNPNYVATVSNPREERLDPLASPPHSGKALLSSNLATVRHSLAEGGGGDGAATAASASGHGSASDRLTARQCGRKLRSTYTKNLVVMSAAFLLVYTAFFSLRSLQSSLNVRDGLGQLSLSAVYGSYVVACFVAPAAVYKIRPKVAMLLAMFGHLIFVLANMLPTFASLVPASVLLGASMALLWTAQGTYLTSIAISYGVLSKRSHDTAVALFNGFFLFVLQIAQVLGYLISSTVFNLRLPQRSSSPLNVSYGSLASSDAEPSDLSNCGSAACYSGLQQKHVADVPFATRYTLVVFFSVCTLLGTLGTAIFLDKLDIIFRRNKQTVCQQFLSLLQLHRDRQQLILIPLSFYLGAQQAFMYSEITRSFVTCPFGLAWFGYVMMTFSVFDALSSIFFARLQKWTARPFIVAIAGLLNASILYVARYWQPRSDTQGLLTVLAMTAGWGIADGIWQTVSCSTYGLYFPDNKEAAFASLRLYESVGLTLTFAASHFFCVRSKIYALACSLVLAVLSESFLEFTRSKVTQIADPEMFL